MVGLRFAFIISNNFQNSKKILEIIQNSFQICSPRRPRRSRAGNDGFRPIRSIRPDLPTRQLRLRPIWRRKQLGQGSLHRRSRARRLRSRRCPKRSRILRLPSRIPADSLARWRNWLRYGNSSHLKNSRRVPRQNHEHLLCRSLPQGKPKIPALKLKSLREKRLIRSNGFSVAIIQ